MSDVKDMIEIMKLLSETIKHQINGKEKFKKKKKKRKIQTHIMQFLQK